MRRTKDPMLKTWWFSLATYNFCTIARLFEEFTPGGKLWKENGSGCETEFFHCRSSFESELSVSAAFVYFRKSACLHVGSLL